jgi:acyl carrier protein
MVQVGTDETLDVVRSELQRLAPEVSVDQLDTETDIATLGIESVTVLELIAALEEHYSIELPDDELTTLDTVGDVIRLIQRHLAVRGG